MQATETLTPNQVQQRRVHKSDSICRSRQPHQHASFTVGANSNCMICKTEKHPLYMCPTFKAMPRVSSQTPYASTASNQITTPGKAQVPTSVKGASVLTTPSFTMIRSKHNHHHHSLKLQLLPPQLNKLFPMPQPGPIYPPHS